MSSHQAEQAKTIQGTFIKQAWGGSKEKDLLELGEDTFDATAYVLGMDLESIHGISDFDDTSDNIGLHHIDHDGPYSVEIEAAICKFFGVEHIEDITQEDLDEAKAAYENQSHENKIQTGMRLRLVLDVEYDFCDTPEDALEDEIALLKANLKGIVSNAMNRGLITEDAYSIVEDYAVSVTELQVAQEQNKNFGMNM